MTHILTLELSDQIFTAIQQQAEAIGIPPEQLAATLLEHRFGQDLKLLLPEAEKETARVGFERHFGTLNLEHPTDLDNENIDADLLREYASTHEEG
ncbi:hypothetical protein [Lyngbya aestuarii]|uniref:hypothetical protein n=1 Tax=Lyngbya aestuarii TaxID=118322 RepID=UPI00403D605E